MRSSSEWNVTTARRPPGLSSRSAAQSPRRSSPSSSLTAMRKRLEGARRRMGRFAGPRRRDAGDHPGKLQGRGERLRLAVGDDGARDPARGALLAEMKQNVGDRRLVLFAQDVGGRAAASSPCACRGARRSAARSRARPRRAASTKRRCRARRRRPRRRRDAARSRRDRRSAPRQAQPAAGRSGERCAGPNGRRVAIERDHARAAVEQRARIAAGAERAVDIDAAGARIERLHRLGEQDGNVAEPGGRGGAHHDAPGGAERVALRAQAPDPLPRLLEMGLEPRRLPDLELVALADEHRLVAEPQRRLQPLLEKDPALRIEAQDLARAQKRRREGVAGLRIGRHRLKQRVDLGDQRVAAAIERRRVERRIGEDALEAVLRQHLAKRRRNRNPPLGVEAVGEIRKKSIHQAALRRASEPASDAHRR